VSQNCYYVGVPAVGSLSKVNPLAGLVADTWFMDLYWEFDNFFGFSFCLYLSCLS
jgi:hypothetical protein